MGVKIIGGGLAGSQAALILAKNNIEVELYEMRPDKQTGAHRTGNFAEIVCSNSLGSKELTVASGLLKEELRILGSDLIKIADSCKVGALAVEREDFSANVNELINNNPYIKPTREEINEIPNDSPCIIASGPLTSQSMSESIKEFTQEENLHFVDAIAPVIEKDSIDFGKAFYANRYDKGDADYINCPMNKEEYEKFYNYLINAETIELKEFEKNAKFFESCLPVEVIAKRGEDTLRFGPLKPVGLVDKRTNEKNYAVVQLRQDDMCGNLYNLVGFQTNLKWGCQKEMISLIPGLENANITRYGVMHRNTYIFSPKVLKPTLQTKKRPDLFFAGQITGVEGYSESIATGLLAGINMAKYIQDKELLELPDITMLGALCNYITFEEHKKLNPINSNWGILSPIEVEKKYRKDKKYKAEIYAKRSLEYLKKLAY
ncbi:MAG: methylenetetrahydrofolate--tRNA-(uracil(54)-C(5))-methyltransferase (FADH(2)-oxidizing) TrmFO [Candidatus Gastranaerophilales bacterium]|nr:methylenetetrahydrofolate--tRNA-(uracil(54)-C(5))-methyltransferase (FADH(2)-oxidizing) TrmFO [Candidatus Gastranaerophilales bacterium]